MSPNSRRAGVWLLATALVLIWSFNYIAAKIADWHLNAETVAAFRLVIAGAIFLFLLLLRREKGRPRGKEWPLFLLLGLFGVVINQGGFTVALNYTSVGHVALIAACGPLMVLLLAWLGGLESPTVAKLAGMVFALGGIAVLTAREGLGRHSPALDGDLLALASSSGLAIFTVVCKRLARRYDVITLGGYTAVAGGVIALPFAFLLGGRLNWGSVGWAGWAGLGYMAICSSVLGYLVFYKLLDLLSATQVSSLNYTYPVVATVLGALLLSEAIGRRFLIAAGMIVVGVWLAERERWVRAPAE